MSEATQYSEVLERFDSYLDDCKKCRAGANAFLGRLFEAMQMTREQVAAIAIGVVDTHRGELKECSWDEIPCTDNEIEFALDFHLMKKVPPEISNPIRIHVQYSRARDGIRFRSGVAGSYTADVISDMVDATHKLAAAFEFGYRRR